MIRPPRHSGFTLIELLMVVAILALVAGTIVSNANPSLRDQLEGAAAVMAGDIAFARSLAVSNDSNYRFTFDLTRNQYVLTHVGTNSALNNLPRSPYALPSDPADQHIVRMAKLPHLGGTVQLYAVRALSSAPQSVTNLEFGPLGETTRAEETQMWLSAGTGTATRYLSVRVNPVTGLTWVENFQANDPLAPASPVGNGSAS